MKLPPTITGMMLTGLLLGWPVSFADTPPCDRADGNLSRYLLCRELTTLGTTDPRAPYEMLDRVEQAAIDKLRAMKKVRTGGPALSRLYSAGRGLALYEPTLLLTDALQSRQPGCDESRGCDVLRADCDLLGVLNYGVAEKYYGDHFAASGFGLVRTDPHHLITAFSTHDRITTILETTNGSMFFNPRGVFDPRARHGARSETYLRLMTEAEIVAMHVGSIGQRLRALGRYDDALAHFDEALALNADEYFAHRGRAEILLVRATQPLRQAGSSGGGCALGELPLDKVETTLLDAAESSIRHALRLDGEDPHSLFLLGAIQYFNDELDAAHDNFRAAARRDSNPVYDYYLGLTRLQLGLNRKAVKSLKASKKREEQSSAADLALALGYRAIAEEQGSYRAARRGATLVDNVLEDGSPEPCTLLLSHEFSELKRKLAHNSGFTFPPIRRQTYDAAVERP